MAIASQLQEHSGLNYVPRERNADGRVFEHASDCRVLIDHLANINLSKLKTSASLSLPNYHKKDGLRSQMSNSQIDSTPTKNEVKDLNLGHFFIKLADEGGQQPDALVEQRIEQ